MHRVPRTLRTDVLVIGGGAAGIRAALAGSEHGAKVLLASKEPPGQSGSSFSPISGGWGMQALVGSDRTPEALEDFHRDILRVGLGRCDPTLARILVEESGTVLEDLIAYGLCFRRLDGEDCYLRNNGCFSRHARAYMTASFSNIQATFRAMLRRAGARVEPAAVTDLLVHEGICWGAMAVGPGGEPLRILARATVLATGGGAAIFRHHLATDGATGDGYAMAARAGVETVNLEFIQFMIGIRIGERYRFFPLHELAERGRLVDRDGDDVLERILPCPEEREAVLRERRRHGPFSCRDSSYKLDTGVLEETRRRGPVLCGAPDGGPEAAQVIPCAHAFNGGVRIDPDGRTTLPGLFAAGEVAAGPHGADRIGGCMMTATQVFGRRAGRAAGRHALRRRAVPWPAIRVKGGEALCEPFGEYSEFPDLERVARAVRAVLSQEVTVLRGESGLRKAGNVLDDGLVRLGEIARRKSAHPGACRTILNMIQAGRMVIDAALVRRESLGAHYRRDVPSPAAGTSCR